MPNEAQVNSKLMASKLGLVGLFWRQLPVSVYLCCDELLVRVIHRTNSKISEMLGYLNEFEFYLKYLCD